MAVAMAGVVTADVVCSCREPCAWPTGSRGRPACLPWRTERPGPVTAVYSLFEQVWATATPFGAPEPVDAHGLNPQELELLKILSEGHTDEVAGRRLNLSLRTVRRMMSQIMDRLGAQSRFQAGVQAAAQGWLEAAESSQR